VQRNGGTEWLEEECDAIGIYRNTKPNIVELPLVPGLTAVVFTDGIWSAGHRSGGAMDVAAAACLNESSLVSGDAPAGESSAKAVADRVLEAALELDNGRPKDDSTVLVIKVGTHRWEQKVRRMEISLPI